MFYCKLTYLKFVQNRWLRAFKRQQQQKYLSYLILNIIGYHTYKNKWTKTSVLKIS